MGLSLTLSLLNLSIVWYGLIALIVYIITMFLSSLVFRNILLYIDRQISVLRSFVVVSIGNLIYSFTPFGLGHFVGRPLAAKFLEDVLIRRTISATAFEEFINFTMYLILFPFLLLFLGEELFIVNNFSNWSIILVVVLVVGIIAYRYQYFLPKIFKVKSYVPKFIREFVSKYGVTEQSLEEITRSLPQYMKNRRLIIYTWIMTIVTMFIMPLTLWAALAYFGQEFSYLTIFSLFWVSYVIGRISLLPAGIGVKDVTMAGLLISLGVAGEMAVKVVIIYRVLSIFPIILIGLPLLLLHTKILFKRQKHYVQKHGPRLLNKLRRR